uniref:Squalene synthase n=1 Tax=Dryopteris fragrans TaxID=239565 RepID=A0A0A0RR94_9MONI|nr:squalene synthase [Dryopteris fragrans]
MGLLKGVLEHPEEIPALVKLRIAAATLRLHVPAHDADLSFCYLMLQRVSRSFALVIQQLGTELRDAICIFYLVLRALDTVEDDMSISVDTKLPVLKSFHKNIHDPTWHFPCGERDYKVLMDEFHHVSMAFLKLHKRYQVAIEDAANKMGHGMAKFICKEVETIEDYDEYCHYVAGLVGLGLSQLFHASGLEDLAPDDLSNSMGLFLQKTNIIRDYLEDINEIPKPRMFWPRDIWGKYASKLEDFKEEENSEAAVECLNDLITNALSHALDCLTYMAALKDHAVFRFCAIPQIMAIGTLAVCYNNVHVFRGVVKIRRGLTAKIMDQTHTMADVYGAFYDFCSMLSVKINKKDPSSQRTLNCVEAIQHACRSSGTLSKRRVFSNKSSKLSHEAFLLFVMILLLVGMLYMVGKSS